jgi:hypothetical protein
VPPHPAIRRHHEGIHRSIFEGKVDNFRAEWNTSFVRNACFFGNIGQIANFAGAGPARSQTDFRIEKKLKTPLFSKCFRSREDSARQRRVVLK